MSEAFLTRARLRHDAPASALRSLLVPDNDAERVNAGHRLVWSLFADSRDRKRDFLWRESEPGHFFLLSRRPPEDHTGLFEVDEPRPFEPALAAGDRLAFMLRANATISRGGKGERRGKVSDVVMDALYNVLPGERAAVRGRTVEEAGIKWLESQAAKAGFDVGARGEKSEAANDEEPSAVDAEIAAEAGRTVRVSAYHTLRLGRRGEPAKLGILDFEGVLEVRDPALFVERVLGGFGRAKAFGCGLMLIRRV